MVLTEISHLFSFCLIFQQTKDSMSFSWMTVEQERNPTVPVIFKLVLKKVTWLTPESEQEGPTRLGQRALIQGKVETEGHLAIYHCGVLGLCRTICILSALLLLERTTSKLIKPHWGGRLKAVLPYGTTFHKCCTQIFRAPTVD